MRSSNFANRLRRGLTATIAASSLSAVTAGQTVAQESVADLPGVRLFYMDTGGPGTPIVLLHAGTGSSRVWEHQLPAFTAAGYRVIAYDRRGYGRTVVDAAGPVGTAPDDLDALLRFLRLERVHLLGTAAGGMVATDFALSYPSRLRSLIIANSVVGVQDPEYLETGRRLRPQPFGEMPPDFRELSPSYRANNPDGTKRWLDLEHISRAPGPRPQPQPAKNTVTFEALASITTPTLFITGEADLYTPPPILRQFAERVRGSQTLILHEVGHSAYWEEPAIFNRAVLDFIRGR